VAKQPNDTEAFLAALAGGLSEDFPDDISDADLSSGLHSKTLGHLELPENLPI
jgi:hypothetical protein